MKRIKITTILVIALLSASLDAKSASHYYYSKTISGSLDEVTMQVKEVLKEQGFGIVSEMDMHKTLNEKVEGANVKPYRLLGACNPKFAYDVIQKEGNIGLFLPCKVLLKEKAGNEIEVVMVNPTVMIDIVDNPELDGIADEVTKRFEKAIKNL